MNEENEELECALEAFPEVREEEDIDTPIYRRSDQNSFASLGQRLIAHVVQAKKQAVKSGKVHDPRFTNHGKGRTAPGMNVPNHRRRTTGSRSR